MLIKHTILKSDHFPGCQNKKLLPLIEGAPNFRQVLPGMPNSLLSQATQIEAQCLPNADVHLCMQVPGLPVYGVAIPTVGGLRLVLDQLQAMQGALFCFRSVNTGAALTVSNLGQSCPCASLLCLLSAVVLGI